MAGRALVSIYNANASTPAWFNLPCPSSYVGISTTVVDSARNSNAQVVGQIIASDVAKIELKWNFLTVEQYSQIAQLFEPKYNNNDNTVFFRPVSFFDVIKGDWDGDISQAPNTTTNKVRLFYPSDRKVDFAKIKLDDDGKPIGYINVSLNLIDTGFKYGENV